MQLDEFAERWRQHFAVCGGTAAVRRKQRQKISDLDSALWLCGPGRGRVAVGSINHP
jgi:hypothetical protein